MRTLLDIKKETTIKNNSLLDTIEAEREIYREELIVLDDSRGW